VHLRPPTLPSRQEQDEPEPKLIPSLDTPLPSTSLLSQPSVYFFLGIVFLVAPVALFVWLRSERYGALRAKRELYRFFGREIRKGAVRSDGGAKYQKVESAGGP
jgi:hypothetical protein